PIERDTYRQNLARILRVSERALSVKPTGRQRTTERQRPRPADEEPEAAAPVENEVSQEVSRLEAFCLGTLLHHPDLLYKVDRELQVLGLPRLAADDFVSVEHQLIFAALAAALEQVDQEPADYVLARVDAALQPHLAAVQAGAAVENNVSDARAADALMRAVLQLRRRTVSNWLR